MPAIPLLPLGNTRLYSVIKMQKKDVVGVVRRRNVNPYKLKKLLNKIIKELYCGVGGYGTISFIKLY